MFSILYTRWLERRSFYHSGHEGCWAGTRYNEDTPWCLDKDVHYKMRGGRTAQSLVEVMDIRGSISFAPTPAQRGESPLAYRLVLSAPARNSKEQTAKW